VGPALPAPRTARSLPREAERGVTAGHADGTGAIAAVLREMEGE
jgi:hypothetical protein